MFLEGQGLSEPSIGRKGNMVDRDRGGFSSFAGRIETQLILSSSAKTSASTRRFTIANFSANCTTGRLVCCLRNHLSLTGQTRNTLRLEGEQMSFNAENIPRVFTQKTENPFLIIGNYVELISHYASSIGHEGIQCYQYFRVIKVLLRTHISAGSCAVCFAVKKGL